MRTFLTVEVPAWLAAHYGVTATPAERAILAISYGAKDALDAALAPNGAYGRLGLLIPGRRLRPADLDAVAGQRGRRLRAAILAGRYDAANLATARDAPTSARRRRPRRSTTSRSRRATTRRRGATTWAPCSSACSARGRGR